MKRSGGLKKPEKQKDIESFFVIVVARWRSIGGIARAAGVVERVRDSRGEKLCIEWRGVRLVKSFSRTRSRKKEERARKMLRCAKNCTTSRKFPSQMTAIMMWRKQQKKFDQSRPVLAQSSRGLRLFRSCRRRSKGYHRNAVGETYKKKDFAESHSVCPSVPSVSSDY